MLKYNKENTGEKKQNKRVDTCLGTLVSQREGEREAETGLEVAPGVGSQV